MLISPVSFYFLNVIIKKTFKITCVAYALYFY